MTDQPVRRVCHLPTGETFAWREWGTGRPLIMLHGWAMSAVVFSEVAALLADRFKVFCPDLPGHGGSDPLTDCRLASFAAAIAQWGQQLQLFDCALLGWSLGGQVAMQVAVDAQLSLQRLLLISTTPRFCQAEDWPHGLPTTQVKALDRNLGRAYEKTMGDFFNLQFAGEELPKQRYRQILAFAVRAGTLPERELARALLRELGAADLRQLLPSIQLPTLVMHGDLDQIIPPEAGAYLARQIAGAQFFRMSDVGHAPFFSDPQKVVRQWRKFLA